MKKVLFSIVVISSCLNAQAMDMDFCVSKNSSTESYVTAKLKGSEIKEASLFCSRAKDIGYLKYKKNLFTMIGLQCDTGLIDAVDVASKNFYAIGFNTGSDKMGWPVITGYAVLKNMDCRSGTPQSLNP